MDRTKNILHPVTKRDRSLVFVDFNYYPDIEFINHLIRIGGLDETENSEKTEIPFLFLSVSRYNKQIINENDSRELQFLFLRVSPAPPIIRYNLE